MRERNKQLVKQAKQLFKDREGTLFCEVCKFDFSKVYGSLGEGYIEAHHTIPISSMMEDHESFPEDLAMLCSNCHKMIHRRVPWLTIDELKEEVFNQEKE